MKKSTKKNLNNAGIEALDYLATPGILPMIAFLFGSYIGGRSYKFKNKKDKTIKQTVTYTIVSLILSGLYGLIILCAYGKDEFTKKLEEKNKKLDTNEDAIKDAMQSDLMTDSEEDEEELSEAEKAFLEVIKNPSNTNKANASTFAEALEGTSKQFKEIYDMVNEKTKK